MCDSEFNLRLFCKKNSTLILESEEDGSEEDVEEEGDEDSEENGDDSEEAGDEDAEEDSSDLEDDANIEYYNNAVSSDDGDEIKVRLFPGLMFC